MTTPITTLENAKTYILDDFDFEPADQMTDASFTFRADPSWTIQVATTRQFFVDFWNDQEETMYHHGCFSCLAAAANYVREKAAS